VHFLLFIFVKKEDTILLLRSNGSSYKKKRVSGGKVYVVWTRKSEVSSIILLL
jgi:hypothetical protein